jgi:hypothetical protein
VRLERSNLEGGGLWCGGGMALFGGYRYLGIGIELLPGRLLGCRLRDWSLSNFQSGFSSADT